MGVDEIYNFLKENKGFHSAKQISEGVKVSNRSVSKSINIITRYKDITCEYIYQNIREGIYKSNLRTRKTWVYAHVNQIKNANQT